MRIVIADDSPLIRERLQDVLRSIEQVEVVGTFNNGIDALNALRTLNPDLAVVDIKMPGLSGLEVLKETRKDNKTLQFIILTLHGTEYYRQQAISSGANYFFSKVDDFGKIEFVINEILKFEIIQTI
jgi:two-component system nitrate/nitrite response regulator NarL